MRATHRVLIAQAHQLFCIGTLNCLDVLLQF